MKKNRSIKLVIYNEYLKAALLPILLIEITLLVMYFVITNYLATSSRQALQAEAAQNIGEIAVREARSINQQLEAVSRLAGILQMENTRLFERPEAFALPATRPDFRRAGNGVSYKTADNGGSSLWYSARQPFTAAQREKAIRTEAMDPLFRATLAANSNIVGIYFNSWDSMNRYFPYLEKVYDVFDPLMDIPLFNFYYLADAAHNPGRNVVWTDAYLDPAGQGWMASCIVPIYRGAFLEGVTGIDMTIDRIVKNILALELPWGGSAFLVDGAGVILAMPERVEEVMGLKELRRQVYTSHVTQDTVKPAEFNLFKNRDPAVVSQMKAILSGNRTVNDFRMGAQEYFLTRSVIGQTGWNLMLLVDKTVVNEPVNRLDGLTRRVGLIAFIIMIAFYAGFFSFLMFKSRRTAARIAAPLSLLAERTTSLKEQPGQAEVAVEDCGIDEINLLNSNFAIMARELGVLYRDLDQKVKTRTAELEKALDDLKRANRQIIQQEKMASIGQLAAGVAHEINNPMAFVMSNVSLMRDYAGRLIEYLKATEAPGAGPEAMAALRQELKIDFISRESGDMLAETLEGVERVKTIVSELRTFSRLTVEKEMADLNAGLRSVLSILWNEIKFKAEVEQDLGDLPPTWCNPGQLNQVFMNIVMNAVQAIPEHGRITIRSWHEDGAIRVSVADTGCGMAPEVIGRIFEPFFTTKDIGKGTGLGLSVSWEIVKSHQGDIQVESRPGQGTVFTIILPVLARSEPAVPAIEEGASG